MYPSVLRRQSAGVKNYRGKGGGCQIDTLTFSFFREAENFVIMAQEWKTIPPPPAPPVT